jgi:hypothetical protein
MKLINEQIALTDTTGWSGPFTFTDVQQVDATKFDIGETTQNGVKNYWTKKKKNNKIQPKKDEPKKDEPKKELVTPVNSKSIFDIYIKKIWFYNKNNLIFNIQDPEPKIMKKILDEIDIFTSDGFNQPSAFLGAILMNYGTQIIYYKTRKNVQDEIDKFLTDLQDTIKARLPNLSEGFKLKKLLGLAQILEQVSEFVKVYVVNGVPKKETEDDKYINTDSKYIETVIKGGDEIRPGEKNGTVKIIKARVGYTVSTDTGNNFTENFKNHLLKYKSDKLLDYNNPNISQQLLCSFDDYSLKYSTWCEKFKTPKTTQAPPQPTPTPT